MCELKRLHMWSVVARQNNTNPVFMYDFPGKCLIYHSSLTVLAELLLVSSSVSDPDSLIPDPDPVF
jgi:hypothetical protein